MMASWRDATLTTLTAIGERLLGALPAVLTLVGLVVIGLALAWAAARVTRRLARALDVDRRAETYGLGVSLRREGISRPPSEIIGLGVFWGLFLLFVALAIDAMAVPGTERLTAFVLVWLPTLVGALVILLVGWLVANFVAQGVLIAAVNAGLPRAGCWRGPCGGGCCCSRAPPPSPISAWPRRWSWSPSASCSAAWS